jgi:hypothetical protein
MLSREWVEPDRRSRGIALDPLEMGKEQLSHGRLAGLRGVYERSIPFHEQVEAVGLQGWVGQGMVGAEPSLQEIERLTHARQAHMMLPPQGVEHMYFDQIDEGE